MELKYIPAMTPQERANLKPKLHEEVMFEGSRYVVTELGMKYVHIKNVLTGHRAIAKIAEITKCSLLEGIGAEPSPFDEMFNKQ